MRDGYGGVTCNICGLGQRDYELEHGRCLRCGTDPDADPPHRLGEEIGYRRGFQQGYVAALERFDGSSVGDDVNRQIYKWRYDWRSVARCAAHFDDIPVDDFPNFAWEAAGRYRLAPDDTATALVGYIYATYDTLTSWLGPPDPDVTDPDKSNAEWTLITDSGHLVDIYDLSAVGTAGTTAHERHLNATWQTEWHVGAGSEQVARDLFGDALRCGRLEADGPEYDRCLAAAERAGRPAGLAQARRAGPSRESEGERRRRYARNHGIPVTIVGPCGRCHHNLIIRYGERASGTLCPACKDGNAQKKGAA